MKNSMQVDERICGTRDKRLTTENNLLGDLRIVEEGTEELLST